MLVTSSQHNQGPPCLSDFDVYQVGGLLFAKPIPLAVISLDSKTGTVGISLIHSCASLIR
jgi:hypothetical protein